MFYQVYHITIFSFSFLYFSNMTNVIALSILFVKHPNKHNQQCNKSNLEKKIPIHVKLGVTWYTYANLILQWQIHIQVFFCFGILKTGIFLQINISWSAFIMLITWQVSCLFPAKGGLKSLRTGVVSKFEVLRGRGR